MRTIRNFVTLFTALTCTVLLASCSPGPSAASAAAVVGDRTVPLDDVQDDIRWLLRNVPEVAQAQDDRKVGNVSRFVLQMRVVHELLATATEEEGLEADPAEVDGLISELGGLEQAATQFYTRPERAREFATDVVLLQSLGEKYRNRLTVDIVGALVTSEEPGATMREQAVELGEAIAAEPGKAAELAAQAGHQPISEQIALSDALANFRLGTALSTIFGVDEGTVVVMPEDPESGTWMAVLVTDRTVGPETGADQADPADPLLFYRVGLALLAQYAEDADIRVNPRYGVWDQAGMQIAEDADQKAGHLLPARTNLP